MKRRRHLAAQPRADEGAVRRLLPPVCACLLLPAVGAAQAQREPTDVAPLTVYAASDPPRVVSTFPADGATIAPGALVVRVTFDQKMLKDGFRFTGAAGGEAPRCLKTPRLLTDEKTFVLLCSTKGASRYVLALNDGPEPGFANVAGRRALATQLAFSTTSAEPVRTMEAAMKIAGLGELDTPVQESP